MDQTVEQLVARAKLHDAEAFSELIHRYEGIAMSIAYARTRNAADAGDIVQDAFLKAWQRLDTLDDPSRFGHWLGRMVRNLAIDLRRRRRPLPLDTSIDPPGVGGVDTILETAEHKHQIDHAVASLDELSRSCVVLRYYENLSSKEIGELLDLSPAAVDMRLSRARGHLKDRLWSVMKNTEA
ncbi:MAG: sigma-70 family RNA polymerase sigma factor [Burkholderiales bacterium]|nr:sigma-70 family RNA polymerase sigma factor [Phycisphaerae bacterium]